MKFAINALYYLSLPPWTVLLVAYEGRLVGEGLPTGALMPLYAGMGIHMLPVIILAFEDFCTLIALHLHCPNGMLGFKVVHHGKLSCELFTTLITYLMWYLAANSWWTNFYLTEMKGLDNFKTHVQSTFD